MNDKSLSLVLGGLLSFSLVAETQPLWPEGKIPDFREKQKVLAMGMN